MYDRKDNHNITAKRSTEHCLVESQLVMCVSTDKYFAALYMHISRINHSRSSVDFGATNKHWGIGEFSNIQYTNNE